jgi:hypothetical protein
VTVFARTTDDALTGLVKRLDELVSEYQDQKLAVVVAFVDSQRDRDAVLADVNKLQQKHEFKNVVLAVPKDHREGVRGLKLNSEAVATVLVYRDKKILVNRVAGAGQLDGAFVESVAKDVKTVASEKTAQ